MARLPMVCRMPRHGRGGRPHGGDMAASSAPTVEEGMPRAAPPALSSPQTCRWAAGGGQMEAISTPWHLAEGVGTTMSPTPGDGRGGRFATFHCRCPRGRLQVPAAAPSWCPPAHRGPGPGALGRRAPPLAPIMDLGHLSREPEQQRPSCTGSRPMWKNHSLSGGLSIRPTSTVWYMPRRVDS